MSSSRLGSLRPILLLLLLLAVTGCSDERDQIAGEWKVTSDTTGMVWNFAKDGTVTSGDMKGHYSFGGQRRMKLQTPFATFVYEVNFAGDKMTWKNTKGEVTELARAQ